MNKKFILIFLFVFTLTNFSGNKIWAKNVVYQGPIYNLFFHPLINYPELAFNQTNKYLDYMDQWFVTVKEFKKIIPELYKRGFVLVSPKDLFEERKDEQGRLIITRKELILPKGKMPLVLSLDDYNFYNKMKLHGTIHRFWVNRQGTLVTITKRNKSTSLNQDDQEVPQILEKFITEHPDFSFNNARGIISLTGYNGIFGYNTHETLHHNYSSQVIEAKKIVRKLKGMGWQFASHSYFHLAEDEQTEQNFENSEKRWLKEVGVIVGPTSYYIFPFGDPWNKNVTRMNFLKSQGYKYFFGVTQTNKTTMEPGIVMMGRFPMDGRSLREKYFGVRTFVNPVDVLDSTRRTEGKP
ncbi:MAG: hypothetical protein H0W64_11605 [Gammaproteobacteria bacterium]|nr:hypothetical protein [Gammaproteobacteria bacterium]